MPLAHHVGGVASLLQLGRKCCHVDVESYSSIGWINVPLVSMVGPSTGQEGSS